METLHSSRAASFGFCWVDWIPFEFSEVGGHNAVFPLKHWSWRDLSFAVLRTTGNICGPKGGHPEEAPVRVTASGAKEPGFGASVWLSVPICDLYGTDA